MSTEPAIISMIMRRMLPGTIRGGEAKSTLRRLVPLSFLSGPVVGSAPPNPLPGPSGSP